MAAELLEAIGLLEENALHPARTIARTIRETGKDAVGCFPIYTPDEIVYAAGFIPVGMWGGKTEIHGADKYLPGFCCSIMRSNMEMGIRNAYDFLKAVIIPAFCDTLKCVCENWKVAVPQIPLIPMVYPQNRNTDCGMKYMEDEFRRVQAELEKISGETIGDAALETAFGVYENYRREMRTFVAEAQKHPTLIDARTRHLIIKAGFFMDKAEYTKIIRVVNAGLAAAGSEAGGVRKVVVTGLLTEPIEVLEILRDNGIAVASDDVAQESRQFRVPARDTGTAIEKMIGRIADQRGCTFLYEEKKTKGAMLQEMIRQTDSVGLIVCMMKFCDPEEFDYPIVKQAMDEIRIPVLYLEIEQQMESFEQVRTRIQSFAEMLS
ncbi:MAG: 2-hydroxyacyl-CoA dehydratase family protein [Clostridiales Family XIII bacterium]|jgi:benzoyl-CoA reductase/2-hydroxyglutaryl-CoA dehydratase subunit BcrC/BadD/HgdB|nr:2-hydroxyacyl-CoA dehydratase family protein [Clostridiales Family XIII bacterium]